MMSRAPDGYVADIAYPALFHRETSPIWIAAAAATIGQQAPFIDAPFRYLDLGCGSGLTLALLAAANPQGNFVGVDSNPLHIAQGRDLTQSLPNARLVEMDFARLADSADAAPLGDAPFDFIVLHGVYSWISDAARACVHRIIDRRLAPGGIVYLHYSSHPGQSVFAGAQAMLRRIADLTPGDSAAKIAGGLACIRALDAAGAGYLRTHPAVAGLLSRDDADMAYLAHDLLARDWIALHVGTVMDAMADLGCTYVGSARLLDNIDTLSIPGAIVPLITGIPEIRARETARDIARNQTSRQDLYRRGHGGLSPEAYRAQLEALRYTGLSPTPATGDLTIAMAIGPVSVDGTVVAPIRHRLASGAAQQEAVGFDELAALTPGGPAIALRCLQMLAVAGEAHVAAPFYVAPETGFNAILAALGHRWRIVPAIGSALPA